MSLLEDRRGRRSPPTGRRRLVLLGATLLVPVLVLLMLEFGLRLLTSAGSRPLFVAVPQRPLYLQANQELIERYLTGASGLRSYIDPIPFLRDKPDGVYRIVVQGGSTAAGFPYGRWAGLAGMLSDRLEATFPERNIEVVTTALAAVNSYTLLDLVDEIIEIEPDAVLIYAGHNEYLGILGVGSALVSHSSREATLLRLALRRLALYQALDFAITSLRIAFGESREPTSLFAQAATGALIPYESEAYARGVAQLEENLGEILERYRAAGIPVYLGTLVSNLRDHEPFVGGAASTVDLRAWDEKWKRFEQHSQNGDVAAQRRALADLLALEPGSADVWYALGRLEDQSGRVVEARAAYGAARDRDRLRFRAPGIFNDRIRELAQRHQATLVEVERRFADASPAGIPGESLLLEHVHPNAEGYFLLADAYYDALARDSRIGDWSRAPDEERARLEMPISALDRVLAAWDIEQLSAGFPFSDPPIPFELPSPRGPVERLAHRVREGELEWLYAMDELLQLHHRAGRLEEAAVVARIVARMQPMNTSANFAAGILQLELKQPLRALRYLERADPDDPRTRAAISRAQRGAARARGYSRRDG